MAQIAESSELPDVGRRLLLGTFANNDAQRARLSALLLAVLRLLVSRRELASEKLVETLDNALPQLLLQAPLTENGLDGRLELFQLLLELGGHVVLRPTGHDVAAPGHALHATLQLLEPPQEWGWQPDARRRATVGALKLLPALLLWLRPPPPAPRRHARR